MNQFKLDARPLPVAGLQVVNAFCSQKELEVKMRVMTRLQNITYVQTLLEKALAGELHPHLHLDPQPTQRRLLTRCLFSPVFSRVARLRPTSGQL